MGRAAFLWAVIRVLVGVTDVLDAGGLTQLLDPSRDCNISIGLSDMTKDLGDNCAPPVW